MKFLKFLVTKAKSFYNAISRFLLTALFLLAAEVTNIINISFTTTDDYSKYILVFILGGFLSLVAEIIYERFFTKFPQRILCSLAAIIITVIYFFAFVFTKDLSTEITIRTIIILFALLIAFIWLPVLKTKVSFNESFMVVFKSLFIALFFATVIWGGISLIIAAIDSLLFRVNPDSFPQSAGIIFILFAPLYFLSLIPNYSQKEYSSEEKDHIEKMTSYGKFLEVLISYIFIPLASVFTLILLVYIIINFSGKFWQNSLLEPMLVAYSIVVIILYVLSSTIKNKISSLFRMIFPKVLLPIVLFQTIASILKVGDAGIPFTRYYVIVYGLFAICSGIIFSVSSIKKNGLIAPILIALLVISIIPPLDAFSVGKRNQISMLEKTLEKNGMLEGEDVISNSDISDSDKEKITQNVEYISMMGYEEELPFLGKDFNLYEDFNHIFGFEPYYAQSYDVNYTYINAYIKEDIIIDISGYDQMIVSVVNIPIERQEETVLLGAFEKDGVSYEISSLTDAGVGKIIIGSETGTELMSFDLYSEMNKLKEGLIENNKSENMLSLEEATFTKENDNSKVKLILRNLNTDGSKDSTNMYIEFYLLVKIK